MPTNYKGTKSEVRALNTFIKLTRSVEALGSRLNNCGSLEGLTISQFGVLETLLHLGSMCQSDLGEKLLRSAGNITLVIDNLEKQGWVRRERDAEDRRLVIIHLTEAGREHINRIFPQHLEQIMREMSVLTNDEQETLGFLCKKIGKGEKE